jgi:hypothetical protein
MILIWTGIELIEFSVIVVSTVVLVVSIEFTPDDVTSTVALAPPETGDGIEVPEPEAEPVPLPEGLRRPALAVGGAIV